MKFPFKQKFPIEFLLYFKYTAWIYFLNFQVLATIFCKKRSNKDPITCLIKGSLCMLAEKTLYVNLCECLHAVCGGSRNHQSVVWNCLLWFCSWEVDSLRGECMGRIGFCWKSVCRYSQWVPPDSLSIPPALSWTSGNWHVWNTAWLPCLLASSWFFYLKPLSSAAPLFQLPVADTSHGPFRPRAGNCFY